jgi:hypothetical protein
MQAQNCMDNNKKTICLPPSEGEPKCCHEPMIVYQPMARPCTHDEEVQTESPLINFKAKERYLSGHGPYRVDRIKGY